MVPFCSSPACKARHSLPRFALLMWAPAATSALRLSAERSLALWRQGNACSDILTDGIRNQWKTAANAHHSHDVDEYLDKFDDNYDYDKYSEDHRKMTDNSSKVGFDLDLMGAGEVTGATAISGAVSASYGLFGGSASASHASSHGAGAKGKLGFDFDQKKSKMSEDEFNNRKKKIQQQIKALKQSNTRSGLDTNGFEQVARTVDSKVTEAWMACMKLAEQDVYTKVIPNQNGKVLKFELKYVAGSGPKPAIKPMVTAMRAGPKDAAECDWVDAKGRSNQQLPIILDQGLVLNVMCQRIPKYENESVSVEVTTNVGSFAGNFENVVPAILAGDVRDFQNMVAEEIGRLEVREKKMEDAIQQMRATLHMQNQTIKEQVRTILEQEKSLANAQRMTGSLDSWAKNISRNVADFQTQLSMGVCRLCVVPTEIEKRDYLWLRRSKVKHAGVHPRFEGSGCVGSTVFKNFAGRIVHKNNKMGGSNEAYTPPLAWDSRCQRTVTDASFGPSVVMDLCCQGPFLSRKTAN